MFIGSVFGVSLVFTTMKWKNRCHKLCDVHLLQRDFTCLVVLKSKTI